MLLQSHRVLRVKQLPSDDSEVICPTLPPKRQFIECNRDDLRLSEVGELLRKYRCIVEGIRTVGGFHVQL